MPLIIEISVNQKLYNPDENTFVPELIEKIYREMDLTREDLDEIAKLIVHSIHENIDTETDIFGNALLPLMPSTINAKHNDKILIDTGELYNSIEWEGIGNEREVFIDDIRADIAFYLQFGTSKMVARPFFGIEPGHNADHAVTQYLNSRNFKFAA